MRLGTIGSAGPLAAAALALLLACSSASQRNDEGALVVALQADGKTLDPHKAVDAASIRMIENVYESLLRHGDRLGELQPGLASSWSMEEGGTQVRLQLREGARFHDGSPVTSADVRFSLDRIRRERVRAAHFDAVVAVETPDERTIVLHLHRPFAPLLTYLAHPMNAVVQQVRVEAGARLDLQDAGSGPFELVEWKKDRHLVLRRIADGQRVIFRPIADDLARSVALRTGQVDLVLDVPVRDVPVLEADPQVVVQAVPGTFWEYVGMNCGRAPFDDVRVRQAVAFAIDRQQIVDLVTLGRADPLRGGHLPARHWAHAPLARHEAPQIERARALLAEAGHGDGLATTLTVGSAFSYQVRAAEVVKQQLAAVGIEVRILPMESGLFFDALGRSDFDLAIAGWVGFVDPDEWTRELFHSEGRYNQQRCADPALDLLLERGRHTVDRGERATIYAGVQEALLDLAPMAFLHLNPQISAWRRDVEGYRVHPTATTRRLEQVRRR